MSDRELLELAAKAIGGRITQWGDETILHDDAARYPVEWNPLEFNGDAMRLAVKLELDVSFGLGGAVVEHYRKGPRIEELDAAEPYAAARRAIVRAAAELGNAMKDQTK